MTTNDDNRTLTDEEVQELRQLKELLPEQTYGGYTAHPAAELFPGLPGDELGELAQDIAKNGQRFPIFLWRGQVLDGRSRLSACAQVGVEPWTEDVTEQVADPFEFSVSANLHRRHLTIGQRAVIAQVLEQRYKEQAASASTRGALGGRGRKKAVVKSDNSFPGEASSASNGPANHSRARAARRMRISEGAVAQVNMIKEGAPDLLPEVASGGRSINSALTEMRAREPQGQPKRSAKRRAEHRKKAAPATTGVVADEVMLKVIDRFRESAESPGTKLQAAEEFLRFLRKSAELDPAVVALLDVALPLLARAGAETSA